VKTNKGTKTFTPYTLLIRLVNNIFCLILIFFSPFFAPFPTLSLVEQITFIIRTDTVTRKRRLSHNFIYSNLDDVEKLSVNKITFYFFQFCGFSCRVFLIFLRRKIKEISRLLSISDML
jgi:hypothetical protein